MAFIVGGVEGIFPIAADVRTDDDGRRFHALYVLVGVVEDEIAEGVRGRAAVVREARAETDG